MSDPLDKLAKTLSQKQNSFLSDSPFIRVNREVSQNFELRRPLIAALEAHCKARVITYFSSFYKEEGIVSDEDAEMIESILAVEHGEGKVILIVNSAGGIGLAAERIVNVCRSYSNNDFEVIVPHMAKSAATMICFGANKIHMSKTAELGPVDPQFRYRDSSGTVRMISAEEYIRSYRDLMKAATDLPGPHIEPYLQQLERYDSRLIEQLTSAQKLATDISVRLLKSSMMAGQNDDEIKEKLKVFLLQEQTNAHGRMITFDEAKACGLNLTPIDLHSTQWNNLWELYVRSNWVVMQNPGPSKLMESSSSSVSA